MRDRWPAAQHFIAERRLNEFFGPDARRGRHHPARRDVQRRDPRARTARPIGCVRRTQIPLYVLNVTYPLVDEEVQRLLRGQARGADDRGGPAGFHRAEPACDPAARRHPDPRAWQGHAADGGRIHRGRAARGARQVSRRDNAGDAAAAAQRSTRAGGRRRGRGARGACAAADLLHRLPGATDLHRDEASGTRTRPAPRQRRHRLPSFFHSAAVQHRRHDDGLRPRLGRGRGAEHAGSDAADDQRDGRRRILAQRPDQRRWQCRVQQDRQRADRGRQRLHSGDRRPGHPLLERRQPASQHEECDRDRGARRRRALGADAHAHLRRGEDARRAPRGADHEGTRAEGDRRPERMHAQQAAPHPPDPARLGERRAARGARAVRRRSRHLHRRSFVHPAFGLPVALGARQSRSFAPRSGRDRAVEVASAAACAGRSHTRRCCAPRSTAPRSSATRPSGTCSAPAGRGG